MSSYLSKKKILDLSINDVGNWEEGVFQNWSKIPRISTKKLKNPENLSTSCVTYRDVIVVSLVLPHSNDDIATLIMLTNNSTLFTLTPKVYEAMHFNM